MFVCLSLFLGLFLYFISSLFSGLFWCLLVFSRGVHKSGNIYKGHDDMIIIILHISLFFPSLLDFGWNSIRILAGQPDPVCGCSHGGSDPLYPVHFIADLSLVFFININNCFNEMRLFYNGIKHGYMCCLMWLRLLCCC